MNPKDTQPAGASFAHLAGIGGGKAQNANPPADDDPEKKPDDSDDENKASDEDKDCDGEDKPEKSKSKKAESDDEDEGDDSKEEMTGKSASARARKRERERCAAIFASPHAASNIQMAAKLAFNTTLSRKEAIEVLSTMTASSESARQPNMSSARQARNPDLAQAGNIGSDAQNKQAAIENSWARAMKRVNGGK